MSLSSELTAYFADIEATEGLGSIYSDESFARFQQDPRFQTFTALLQRLSPERGLLVVLRALASLKSELTPRLSETTLVVTSPGNDPISARHTFQVVRHMIASAKTEIIVAGYAITYDGGLIPQLLNAARRGLPIMLFCSTWKPIGGKTAATLILEQWPSDIPRPHIYEYESNPETGASAMHIKCILVDRSDLLLGSANFTFPGMNSNFEMGIRISGPVALSARNVFDEFLRAGRFTQITSL